MKKSYTFNYTLGTMRLLIDGVMKLLTSGDEVYLTAAEYALYSDYFTESTTWKTVYAGEISVGSSTEDKELVINDLDGTKKLITVNVAVDAGSAASLPTDSVVTMVLKDSAGSTIETRTFKLGTIAAAGSESFIVLASGWPNADSLTTTIAFEQDGSNIVTIEDSTVTLSDIANDVAGASFTVGSSVAATNPIVTNIQLKDSDFADLTKRGIVEVFAFDTLDSLDTLSDLSVGSDGLLLGTLTANKSLMVLSESDGDVDVSATSGVAGRCRLGIKVGNEIIAYSDELIWS